MDIKEKIKQIKYSRLSENELDIRAYFNKNKLILNKNGRMFFGNGNFIEFIYEIDTKILHVKVQFISPKYNASQEYQDFLLDVERVFSDLLGHEVLDLMYQTVSGMTISYKKTLDSDTI